MGALTIDQNVEVEEWRPVVGYEGRYEISSFGRVKSLVRKRVRIIKNLLMPNGYIRVTLCNHPHPMRCISVHILVLEAFRGLRPSPEHDSAHDNGTRADNRLTNLFWRTKAENAADRDRHGTTARGERQGSVRLTEEGVIHIRSSSLTRQKLADRHGVAKSTIDAVLCRRTWKHV